MRAWGDVDAILTSDGDDGWMTTAEWRRNIVTTDSFMYESWHEWMNTFMCTHKADNSSVQTKRLATTKVIQSFVL